MKKFILLVLKIVGVLIITLILYIGISVGVSYIGKVSNDSLAIIQGSQFQEVFGRRLAYRLTPAIGKENSRGTVLLIHGFAAWGKTWIDQENLFSKENFDVYSLDLPPFGMSDIYDSLYFSRDGQAKLINQFIKEKGLKNIILVAHSYGGKGSMEAYMQNTSAFSGLILLDVALGFPRIANTPIISKEYSYAKNIVLRGVSRFIVTNQFIGTLGLESFLQDKRSLSPERLALYKIPFQIDGKGDALGDWLYYLDTHHESGLSTNAENYRNINIPSLILWGEQDTVTPISEGEELHRMMASSTLIKLSGVNHIPQIEAPEEVEKAIKEFLAKNFK